jgi:N6-adenosine-specific RNA methylase IME4
MLKIDNEFKNLIPPLSKEEYEQLEKNILEFGIQDDICTWNGIIIDGHNRYEIACRHGLGYKTSEFIFNDRQEVICWMIDNQVGRRNLADFVKFELKDKKTEILKEKGKDKMSLGGGDKKSDDYKSGLSIIDKPDNNIKETHNTQKIIADELKWSTGKVAQAKIIKDKAPEEVKEKLRNKEITINQAYNTIKYAEKEQKREEKRQENQVKIDNTKDITKLEGVYQTILIDPPWDWSDEGDVDQFGRAKPDYQTMTIDELMKLPVGRLSDDNCHLYLWVTNRSLPKAFNLINEWGFRYITCITWVKPSFGMGNYFRGSTEQLLFAVKGSQPLKRKDVGTHFMAERGKGHSSKPECVYDLIESCSHSPYLEMFSRKERSNWTMWGEANG